jgi:beta-glucanase (GH16 family)
MISEKVVIRTRDIGVFLNETTRLGARFLSSSPENTNVKNGILTLQMTNLGAGTEESEYQSAGISTKSKFSFKYGKVEVKVKFKQAIGSWPAIWLMPEKARHWPETGEIDIMEHLNRDDNVFQTIHNSAVTDGGGLSKVFIKSPFKVNEFNIYGIQWTESYISFYVNKKLTYTYHKPQNATEKEWPFDNFFYLILNQSGGAGWPGKALAEDFPFEMKVDWVKIYQHK